MPNRRHRCLATTSGAKCPNVKSAQYSRLRPDLGVTSQWRGSVMRYQVHRFSNGLTVATAPMPHMASVSVGLWIGVGGRFETAQLNGASHFIEHMLFKGTQRRTARQISQAVEGIGGYLNAFTGEENTCFYAKAGCGHFEELIDVLSDMFLHSRFQSREVDKEREVIKE